MTELVAKLMQRQTRSSGVINIHQRHCHDVTIQSHTDRLMQRLQLAEQHLRRYILGILQPGAIAQRFSLRRVELTEWGQVPDVTVLPGRLQPAIQTSAQTSTQTSTRLSAQLSAQASTRTSAQASTQVLTQTSVQALTQASTQALTQTSTQAPNGGAIAVIKPSLPSSYLERSAAHPSLNSQAFQKAQSASPAFDQTANNAQIERLSSSPSLSPSGELDLTPIVAFRIRRGGSYSPKIPAISDSVLTVAAESEPTSPALSRSITQAHSALSTSPSEVDDRAIHPEMPQLKMSIPHTLGGVLKLAQSLISSSQRSSFQGDVKHTPGSDSQKPNSVPESRRSLPIQGKLPSSQTTTDSMSSLLPISGKVNASRSQPTSVQTYVSLPSLISVKPQPRLPTAPTVLEPSPALPLLQRKVHLLPEAVIAADAFPQVTSQLAPIPAGRPVAPMESVNLDRVAEEVSRLLSRRLMFERERRGIRP